MTETLTTFDDPGRPAVAPATMSGLQSGARAAAAWTSALDGERQVCDLTNWSGTDQDERLRLLRRDLQATFGFRLV